MIERTRMLIGLLAGAAVATVLSAAAQAQETVKIGLLATLEGPFAAGGQDGMRGAELAVKQRNGMARQEDRDHQGLVDAKPDVAVNATRKLVEQDKVQSWSARCRARKASPSRTTQVPARHHLHQRLVGRAGHDLVNPSPNFFRFKPKARSGWSGSATTR